MLYWAFIVALLLVIFIVLFKYVQLQNEMKNITRTTAEVRSGNLNLRYRLHTNHKALSELGAELNRLVDYFQKAFERTRFLEEERKRMIANMSHDLRTPLTSLLGYMEALQQDTSLSAEEKEAFLRVAVNKGDDLLALLQDFFELARLETDDSTPDLERINLTELVHEVLIDFYPELTKAGLTPVIEMPDSPLYVRGNKAFLRRIMNNLLSNSLRYGTDGGEIGIRIREQSGSVLVDVWDKGQGIAAHDLPYIFERLYTGEASRNASLRGTGLGLTIVKNLVEKQGGQITAHSAPNEKTIFSFNLMKS
ncbi:His Kinase A (phospho-acceptor) domain-containing protein [Paenibacillus catalpae]|uniref:histidine kinase n=1 Tax=Paenibacillus catalpae TaxID=1045775 RepID=A0A1I2GMX6_9BACL|nr:HAMP domain-containing sensor histidine kinase [Paenibacillus catalpae]SFF17961.1 His Kinase A (phospho-acceptor) domain-containing protein [Paenibacillus catalpae]